jgi:hypothetical protein
MGVIFETPSKRTFPTREYSFPPDKTRALASQLGALQAVVNEKMLQCTKKTEGRTISFLIPKEGLKITI